MAIAGMMFRVIGAVLVVAIAWLYLKQDHMVYPRRQYREGHEQMVPARAVPLEYSISCGKQKAWYVPPKDFDEPKAAPERIWIMFGGNASLALFWNETVTQSPDTRAGFILFDYPGYGFCEGDPSPQSIQESAEAVVDQLASYLEISPEEIRQRPFRLMGHSLGSGMALQYASKNPVDRVVLIAPFSSMRDMANRIVTPVLGWISRHTMDNMAFLRKIAAQENPPQVIVVHGTNDEIVPVQMGRLMKEQFPELVEYEEVEGANHTDILNGVERFMKEETGADPE